MPDDEDAIEPGGDEMVPVVFARSEDEAEVYIELLNDHDIPAVAGDDPDAEGESPRRGLTRGVPVLVPEALLDEAGEVVADREDTEDFRPPDLSDDEEDAEEDEDETLGLAGEIQPPDTEIDEENREEVFGLDEEDLETGEGEDFEDEDFDEDDEGTSRDDV